MSVVMVEERWLTVEEAAAILKASKYTIREWLRTGRMQGTQWGGRKLGWRIPESEVNRMIKEGLRPKSE